MNKGFTCFHHCVYLIQTKVSVSLGDSLAEAVRERVQHAVMWVHWGQTVLLQLVGHNAHKLLHPFIVVSPVTHNLRNDKQVQNMNTTELFTFLKKKSQWNSKMANNLQAMCQVTICVWKVWLQFQGCAVGCNSLWDVSRILWEKINRLKVKLSMGNST